MTFEKLVQNLSKLREVNLNGVNMSLVAPSSLMNLSSSLASLKLEYCGLQGKILDNVFQQPNLQLLDLLGNEGLNGSLPRHNWNNSLQSLSLSRTKIQIHLEHDFISNLKSVETLDLSACNFEGSNLELFDKLTQLIELRLSHNNFSGQIPSSLENLKKLLELDLFHNNFNDLGNNRIDGTCPHFLETLPELQVLVLQSNELHGMVKGSSTNYSFSKLQIFDLSNNMLSGPLPAEYFNNFKAMMNVDVKMKYMGSPNYNYDYSASLTLKGLKIELVKIQTLLTTIDLSRNKLR
ncbi:receptor-like protein 9DC3 [Hevea brasiliensis]|uniref:receptor-like protein 9DC3 n=1 Tax=Hevea brasiliensis TaxID=3981 RepID=UPI0025CD351D|nr:receptor-like protein 9DC3 [Hevea brasiliensis]